jgi:hypothetical protein
LQPQEVKPRLGVLKVHGDPSIAMIFKFSKFQSNLSIGIDFYKGYMYRRTECGFLYVYRQIVKQHGFL